MDISSIKLSYALLKRVNKISMSTRSLNLAHKIHGKNVSGDTPVFVLHGLLGSKRNWESVSKKMALFTQKMVVAVDARNHGDSPHDNSHTYPDLASDVLQLMNKLSIKKANVIGHSMGGRTGMILALNEPSKVASLVIVDISPVSTPGLLNNFFPKLIDAMKSVNFQGLDNVAKARIVAKTKIMASGVVKYEDSLSFVLMNIGTKPDNTIGWKCNLDALLEHFNSIASFPNVTGKLYPGRTLFIGGDQSNYLPPEDLNGIRVYFPQAEMKIVKRVGHNVHAEDPATFLEIVTEFISKNK